MSGRLVRSNSRSGCSNSISKHTKISSIMPNSLPAISNSKRWLRSLLNDTVKLKSTPIAIGAVQIFSRKCKLYLFFAPASYLNDMMYLCRVQPNWPILGKSKTVTTSCACSGLHNEPAGPRATDTGKSPLRFQPSWIFLYTLIEIVVLKSPKQVGKTIYVLKHPSTEKSRQLTYPTPEDSE